MGLLNAITGKNRPEIPEGMIAFVSMENPMGTLWHVRYRKPEEDPTIHCKGVGPPFDTLPDAEDYLRFVNKEVSSFTYKPGAE